MPRFIRPLLLALGLLLVLTYGGYLAVGNWLLRGELESRLNRRPESMRLVWRSAWTAWPGVVHVEGFEIRGQTRAVQWWAAVERGTIDVDLAPLLRRRFSAHDLAGEGVSFRLRRRRDVPRPWRTDPALAPPIPGLTNPPQNPPEKRPRPPRGRRRPAWRIELAGMDLAAVREIWIEEIRFRGNARVVGGFGVTVRERAEVFPSRVEVGAGELQRGGRPLLGALSGTITGRLEAFDPMRFRGRKAFRFATGRVQLDGQVGGLGAVDALLRGAPLDLAGGSGPLTADVRLRRGRFRPGSRIEVRPREVRLAFLDYEAAGTGRVAWAVLAGRGPSSSPSGRLSARLERFTIQRRGYARPHVRGRDLAVTTWTPEPVFERLFFPVSLAIDMPEAEVPDLTFYNAYLPERSGLILRKGRGRLAGHFRAASPGWVGSGTLSLTGRGIAATFRDTRLAGDFALATRLRRADLKARTFDVAGTDFEIENVSVTGKPVTVTGGQPSEMLPGWWLRGHLDRGLLRPGRPVYLETRAEATMRDPRPLVALFAPGGRTVRWMADALNLQGVGATADVRLGQNLVEIDPLAAAAESPSGRELELRARLRVRDGTPRGALYARWGRLDVGLAVAGAERDWKLVHPRQWFESGATASGPGSGPASEKAPAAVP